MYTAAETAAVVVRLKQMECACQRRGATTNDEAIATDADLEVCNVRLLLLIQPTIGALIVPCLTERMRFDIRAVRVAQ